ncbi:MAG: lysophospholipid acyltransferase family protein [Gammaproteobacteria bacterium]|nr:lysophospholipid acyltransferase family protein [Gammaproteobacteria bacterium]
MLKLVSRQILKLLGWTLIEDLPRDNKFVVIGYPHTSNWDFPLGLLAMWSIDRNFNWVAKHTLFKGPMKYIFRAMGGIPVNRSLHTGFIKNMVDTFNSRDQMIFCIMPEGTRSKTEFWKTGFYHIAHEAQVPVALGYLDYKKKQVGVGGVLYPSGDIDADFEKLREFYKNKVGKKPENQGEVKLKSR